MDRTADLNRRRIRAAKATWRRLNLRRLNGLDRTLREWCEVLADAGNRNAMAIAMIETAGFDDMRALSPQEVNALFNGENVRI